MFYIYWILMMISLITSFAYLSNSMHEKNHKLFILSLIQCFLAVCLPFMDFLFSTANDYTKYENVFVFLWQKLYEGNTIAFVILLGYLALFGLVVMNGKSFITKKDHSVMC